MATTQEIQVYVLALAVKGDVLRMDVVKALNVKPAEVDAAMAKCSLVKRVTANGGSYVRYRIAY